MSDGGAATRGGGDGTSFWNANVDAKRGRERGRVREECAGKESGNGDRALASDSSAAADARDTVCETAASTAEACAAAAAPCAPTTAAATASDCAFAAAAAASACAAVAAARVASSAACCASAAAFSRCCVSAATVR